MAISQKDFDNIVKGTKVSFNRGTKNITIIAVSKPRILKSGTIRKVIFKDVENLKGCKYYMYCRERFNKDNSISLAFGDMPANEQNLKFI